VEKSAGRIETVGSEVRPATPTTIVRTAVPELFAACIAQRAGRPAGLWCIGHIAPASCPHVHSSVCGSAALVHNVTGTDATAPNWQSSQMAVAGPSTRRRCVIPRHLTPRLGRVSNRAVAQRASAPLLSRGLVLCCCRSRGTHERCRYRFSCTSHVARQSPP
jgi:hypothetical protein